MSDGIPRHKTWSRKVHTSLSKTRSRMEKLVQGRTPFRKPYCNSHQGYCVAHLWTFLLGDKCPKCLSPLPSMIPRFIKLSLRPERQAKVTSIVVVVVLRSLYFTIEHSIFHSSFHSSMSRLYRVISSPSPAPCIANLATLRTHLPAPYAWSR